MVLSLMMIINPASKKLAVGGSNQLILRLASFRRRFVERVKIPAKIDNAIKDNKLLKEKMALVRVNNK